MDNYASPPPSMPAYPLATLALVRHEAGPSRKGGISARHATPPDHPAANLPSPPAVSAPVAAPPLPTAHDAPGRRENGRQKNLQVAVIMSSLCACVLVAAVDITIIATALPAIAAQFHSATGYQWVGSAYVLGSAASTPSWGRVSGVWGRKPVLLLAIVVFFVGSLMCALLGGDGGGGGGGIAAFLAGRAVQGVGASGLLTLVNITISDMFSLRDRGLYYGLTSVVWAVASGIGPVLGGVFTQQLSWRWCFWINLPISALGFVFLYFTMPQDNPGVSVREGLGAVDWAGSLLIVGATLMLLLGLNLGGLSLPWSSATVVNLIVFGVFAGFLFGLNEWKLARYPVMPPRLFRTRSSAASLAVCFCHGYVMMGVAYYLPLYFQAVLGAGPLLSGVYLLPFILADTCFAAATGLFIQRTGTYLGPVYAGLVLSALGTGLLADLGPDANWPKMAAYQILAGAGIGMNFEGPLLALQAGLTPRPGRSGSPAPVTPAPTNSADEDDSENDDVAAATATIGFTRTLSTAVSAVIGGVVFQNHMAREAPLLAAALGPAAASLLQGGHATASVDIIASLTPDKRAIARAAFCRSLKAMWIMYVAFAGLGLLAGCFVAAHPLSKELRPGTAGAGQDLVDENREPRRDEAVAAIPTTNNATREIEGT